MTKELLLQQFDNCYDENGWFSSLKHCLKALTAEQAAWRAEGADNSIWEIIAHLNYYNHAYLERFRGGEYEYKKADNEATFEQADEVSEDAWAKVVHDFEHVMSRWREEIQNADEPKLAQLAPPRNEVPWWHLIANINTHIAHHGGQIVILRKLQGSWDASAGVS
jgi:uncharacterized damage-inducible protein DinB